jgi:hypothetical protein
MRKCEGVEGYNNERMERWGGGRKRERKLPPYAALLLAAAEIDPLVPEEVVAAAAVVPLPEEDPVPVETTLLPPVDETVALALVDADVAAEVAVADEVAATDDPTVDDSTREEDEDPLLTLFVAALIPNASPTTTPTRIQTTTTALTALCVTLLVGRFGGSSHSNSSTAFPPAIARSREGARSPNCEGDAPRAARGSFSSTEGVRESRLVRGGLVGCREKSGQRSLSMFVREKEGTYSAHCSFDRHRL